MLRESNLNFQENFSFSGVEKRTKTKISGSKTPRSLHCFNWNSSFGWDFKTLEVFCPLSCGCSRETSDSSCPQPFGYSCAEPYAAMNERGQSSSVSGFQTRRVVDIERERRMACCFSSGSQKPDWLVRWLYGIHLIEVIQSYRLTVCPKTGCQHRKHGLGLGQAYLSS